MVIRRFGREFPPATEEGKAKFRALFSDDERAILKEWWADAKWISPEKARQAVPMLRSQYESYLQRAGVPTSENLMQQWKTVSEQQGGIAGDVRRARLALSALSQVEDILTDNDERESDAKEAVALAFMALLPMVAVADRLFKALDRPRQGRDNRKLRSQRWANHIKKLRTKAQKVWDANPDVTREEMAQRLLEADDDNPEALNRELTVETYVEYLKHMGPGAHRKPRPRTPKSRTS